MRGYITLGGRYYEADAPVDEGDVEVALRPSEEYAWDGSRWVTQHLRTPHHYPREVTGPCREMLEWWLERQERQRQCRRRRETLLLDALKWGLAWALGLIGLALTGAGQWLVAKIL